MQLKDVAPSYGVALAVAVPVYFLKYLPLTYWVVLPMQILVGAGIFFLLCEKTKLLEYQEVKKIANDYRQKLKRKK